MKNTVIFAILAASMAAVPSRAQETNIASALANLREQCVSVERVSVAHDTQNFDHVTTYDYQAADWCRGIITGFILGANHTVFVMSPPMRLEILTSEHGSREEAKAIVAYLDAHQNADDGRDVLLGAFLRIGAAQLLTLDPPNCPKDAKDVPAGGCILH